MKQLVISTLALVILLLSLSFVHADEPMQVKLAWDPSTSVDVVGVRLYKTTIPGQYTYGADHCAVDIPVGIETGTITIVGDGLYYFVATAYDASGNESGSSNEVSQLIDTTPPDSPTNLFITIIIYEVEE